MSHAYCVARHFGSKSTHAFREGPGLEFRSCHGGGGMGGECHK